MNNNERIDREMYEVGKRVRRHMGKAITGNKNLIVKEY